MLADVPLLVVEKGTHGRQNLVDSPLHALATNPTPFVAAPGASHVGTPFVFFDWSLARATVAETLADVEFLVELLSVLLAAYFLMFRSSAVEADHGRTLGTWECSFAILFPFYYTFTVCFRTEYLFFILSDF